MNTLGPIIRPSASTVECVQMLDVTLQSLRRELSPVFLQAEVRKDSEPKPISVGHAVKD